MADTECLRFLLGKKGAFLLEICWPLDVAEWMIVLVGKLLKLASLKGKVVVVVAFSGAW